MTRQILLGEADLTEQVGRPMTCQYHLLVRTISLPLACESYGVGIEIVQTGEREEVWDITVRPERIEELTRLLLQGGVTPCTLGEVVADWL